MKVLGVNTSSSGNYVSIYFCEHLTAWMTDGRKARCFCPQIESWLEEQLGIMPDEYIMRDIFTQPKSRSSYISDYSYTHLQMHNEEHVVALKTFYPEYNKGF